MLKLAPSALLDHYLAISRLLAGQLEFRSAIRAVAAEISHIIPHDHLDVCIIMHGGQYHTAYETGLETAWGNHPPALVSESPIRSVLWGDVGHLLTDDAGVDPRFNFEGAFVRPIFDQALRSRLHVPLKVEGDVIGALSCSAHTVGLYGLDDVANARSIADLLSPYFFALRAAEQAQQWAIVEAEARAREEGLRLGALRLTEALESERQRIGMDLHDQTLADLTRLSRRLERLTHEQGISGETLEPLARSLQHCMQDLRQIIEEAKPSVLQLFGFAQAVENQMDRSIRDSGLMVTQKLVDDTGGIIDKLEPTVSIALFRITQEAINNAVRHARADHIVVTLTAQPDGISIEVRDDGIGIQRLKRRSGTGIDNMKTRARLISARFSITEGHGTRGSVVAIHLPLSAQTPGRDAKLRIDA
jgi:signal transduction histidine kinase